MFKKRAIRMVGLLVLCVISMQMVFFAADSIGKAGETWKEKVSPALLETMQTASETEKITVYVWVRDIDVAQVEAEVEKQTGYTKDTLEQPIPLLEGGSLETRSTEETNRVLMEHKERTEPLREKERLAVDSYTTAKRSLMKKAYQESNPRQLQRLDITEEDVVFTSQYTPMNIVKLTPAQIKNIALNPTVELVELYEEPKWERDSSTSVLQTVGSDYIRDTVGYKGNGVKIGLFDEFWPSNTYSVTKGKVTHIGHGVLAQGDEDHALDIACIILNAVPNAHIYAVCYANNYDSAGFYRQMELLVDQGVSVISISFGSWRGINCTNWYTPRERWLDHICSGHGISVVKSAGNTYGDPSDGGNVPDPGLAFNVVTVGAINDKDTGSNRFDDIIYPKSSSGNGGNVGCAKPDVMAPGNAYGEIGTSYATPVVTGMIAQMQQCKPVLKSNPWLVKAVLTASCDRKVTSESMFSGLTAREGAGIVNARRVYEILSKGRYTSGNLTGSETSKSFNVTGADTVLNIGCAWNRASSATGSHGSGGSSVAPYTDLNLYIYRYDGVLQGKSTLTKSSAEMVFFYPTGIGTYSIRVSRSPVTYTGTVNYALAWY